MIGIVLNILMLIRQFLHLAETSIFFKVSSLLVAVAMIPAIVVVALVCILYAITTSFIEDIVLGFWLLARSKKSSSVCEGSKTA